LPTLARSGEYWWISAANDFNEITGVSGYPMSDYRNRQKSKKAPRPGAFLLPKPKPMRRITLLKQYNVGSGLWLHKKRKK